MDDLISRQAAIDAIEKCHKRCCRADSNGDEWIHYETALNEIECLLPAEPQVRYCRECKWWDAEEGSTRGFCHAAKHCHMSGTWDISIYRKTEAGFFCGDAAAPDPEEEEEEEE